VLPFREEYGGRVKIIIHPLVQEILTVLRNKDTPPEVFRTKLSEIGTYLGYEVLRTFDVEEVLIETPLSKAKGVKIKDLDRVVIVNVLRAAIPLVEGLLKVFPKARIGIVSARRVEKGIAAPDYVFDIEMNYIKLPNDLNDTVTIVADPMFATGCTMLRVLEEVYKRGKPRRCILITVISTRLAIERVLSKYPVEVFTAAIDEKLDERGYIVPGLGDAGDRALGVS